MDVDSLRFAVLDRDQTTHQPRDYAPSSLSACAISPRSPPADYDELDRACAAGELSLLSRSRLALAVT